MQIATIVSLNHVAILQEFVKASAEVVESTFTGVVDPQLSAPAPNATSNQRVTSPSTTPHNLTCSTTAAEDVTGAEAVSAPDKTEAPSASTWDDEAQPFPVSLVSLPCCCKHAGSHLHLHLLSCTCNRHSTRRVAALAAHQRQQADNAEQVAAAHCVCTLFAGACVQQVGVLAGHGEMDWGPH